MWNRHDVARRGDGGQAGKQFGHARFMVMLNRNLFVKVGQCSQTCNGRAPGQYASRGEDALGASPVRMPPQA